MNALMSRQDFSSLSLGLFLDEFGTQVIFSAVLGGKFVNQASWNIKGFADTGFSGLVYDAIDGCCTMEH